MYPESFSKNLNYKFRELELVVKQLTSESEPSEIDIDLALEKTRQLYDLLLRLDPGSIERTDRKSLTVPTGKPVVPSDPDPVEDEKVYEAEGIIPSPVPMEREKPGLDKEKANESGHGKSAESRQEEATESKYSKAAESNDGKEDEMKKINKGEEEGDRSQYDKASASRKNTTEANQEKEERKPDNQNNPDEIEIVADRYQSSQNYINQAIASKQTKKDLTTRLQSKPIADLRNSIGLNDKFLFIKEIFKGRPEKYNQCIDQLNKSASYEEALSYLKDNYSLDENNKVVKKLLSLVKRKHQS